MFTFKGADITRTSAGRQARVVDSLGQDATSTPDTTVAGVVGPEVDFTEDATDG